MSKTNYIVSAILILIIGGVVALYIEQPKGKQMQMLPRITKPEQLRDIFPYDARELINRTERIIQDVQEDIDTIIARSDEALTFDNTIQAYDRLTGGLQSWGASLHVLHMAAPDQNIRDTAYRQMLRLEEFVIDQIEYNIDLYQKLKACGQRLLDTDIAVYRKRYIQDLLDAYKKRGLGLPKEQRVEAMELSKKLVQRTMEFDTTINQDDSHITASRDQLDGLEESFVQSLEQIDDGVYKLGTDYPTYHRVMENCRVVDTRYRMWKAFVNRAYPHNRELLKEIISLRQQFAQKVGYQDYAHLDIDEEEMAENPEAVEAFLNELRDRTQSKWDGEYQLWINELPDSVYLDDQKRIKPWDVAFVKNAYKKQHHQVDETQIMNYFPLEHTLQQLLSIYESFFGITFKTAQVSDLWHEDVRCVQAYYNGELMGHILMDLFPRENKYSHAAQISVVPSYMDGDTRHPGVVFLVANFPKPKADTPALLKRDDVMTFFHEFGHVLHTLFGATQLIGQAGTSVATDFVELPSQMLEEWLYNYDILKQVSCHHATGEPLSDEMIRRIQGLQTYDAGFFVQRQVALSQMSLYSFSSGADVDPDAIFGRAFSHLHSYIMPSDENHFYAAFGHLTGYGAKYYSYLWSKVYAIDVFSHIHEHGLLDQGIGQRYARDVLMPGDSRKPMHLLTDFLDREPSREAFYRYYNFT